MRSAVARADDLVPGVIAGARSGVLCLLCLKEQSRTMTAHRERKGAKGLKSGYDSKASGVIIPAIKLLHLCNGAVGAARRDIMLYVSNRTFFLSFLEVVRLLRCLYVCLPGCQYLVLSSDRLL